MQKNQGLSGLSPERLELLARMAREKKERAAAEGKAPKRSKRIEPLPRNAGEEQTFPVSFAQERLWFLDAVEPGLVAYNEPSLTRIRGPFDGDRLAEACRRVVARHEALRTHFRLDGGVPVQVVVPAEQASLEVPTIDLGEHSATERLAVARRLAAEVARQPFELGQGPLLRLTLYRLATDDHLLLVVFHHIAADGWSYVVFVRELAAAYAGDGSSALPELPVQYGDYAAWQRQWLSGPVLERQVAHWKQHLDGVPQLLELPTDRLRPSRPRFEGSHVPLAAPASLHSALGARAQREGGTFLVLLLAGYQVFLGRYAGATDFAVGIPVAGRNRTELEGLVGFFVNTLVLRAQLTPGRTVGELLANLRQTTLEALAHQDLPFDRLVQELQADRAAGHNPLFQAMLAFQNELPGAIEISGLSLTRESLDIGTTKFDLNANLYELDGRLEGSLEYSTELFDRSTALRMVHHFRNLLHALADADADLPIADLPMLSPSERHQLRAEWNDTVVVRPPVARLHRLVETQVDRTPDAEAVRSGGESLSYRELDRRANRLAHHLRSLGVGPEVLVGVMLERSLDLVVALLGVLKAGGAYVPLDPEYPAERLDFFVADAAPRVLLTAEALMASVPERGRDVALCLDDAAILAEAPDHRPEPLLSDAVDPLAYMIYTSGSTGRPKGAMNGHRGILNRIRWMAEACGIGPGDRFLQKTPFSFDVSVWEFFAPLSVGACLVMARPGGHRDPEYLTSTIVDEGITTVHFVPSMLRAFLEGRPDPATFASVVRVVTSGEALTPDLAGALFERFGELPLINLYGPTETAIEVTGWTVRHADLDRPVPIGRPLANLAMRVLDHRGNAVPVGVSGELMIGGVAVGRGYHGRPSLTAERFIPDAASGEPGARVYRTGDLVRYRTDGAIDFLGRLDFQVKVRGFRIELGEIEAALGHLASVREAVVGVRDVAGDQRLIAYVVPADGEELDSASLREALLRSLPEYMVPSSVVALDAMPLNPAGKADRKALARLTPEVAVRRGERLAPRNTLEEEVHGIWAEVLAQDGSTFGVDDSFFDLGGHSLLMTRVAARVREVCGVELPLRRVFEVSTVAELALEIEAAQRLGLDGAPAIGSVPRQDPPRLSFAQERLWFLDQLEPGSAAYNIPGALRLRGELDDRALEQALGEIVRRHEVLRTTYDSHGGVAVQVIQPAGAAPVPLERVDLTATAGADRDAALEALAADDAAIPFDLTTGPVLRAKLIQLADDDHAVLVNTHHIASDGWSLGVLVLELAELYGAFAAGQPSSLPELPVQYADFAAWQREWLSGEVLDGQLAHWRRHLDGAPLVLDLPTDRPRPAVETFQGTTARFTMDGELRQGVEALAKASGATPFMVLLAAWKALVFRSTGQRQLLTGSPVAGRTHGQLEELIGFFVNTLVLRADLGPRQTFTELVDRVRASALGAFEHQDLPFERLVEALQPERDPSRSPLVQVLFAFQSAPQQGFELPGLTMTRLDLDSGTSKFDLSLLLAEDGEGIRGAVEYNTDLFDSIRIERLIGQWNTLLTAVLAEPGRALDELSLLSPAEAEQVIHGWNATAVGYDQADSGLHELFKAQVERTPNAMAVRGPDLGTDGDTGTVELTYRQLDQRINRLAHHLRDRGVGPEVLVGVMLRRSVDRVVALYAVLEAGGAYVPLDPDHPSERLALCLEDAAPRLVITSDGLMSKLGADVPTVRLDIDAESIAAQPDTRPSVPMVGDRLAYVIFTSGSTGRPKGAMNAHRGIVNRILWMQKAYGLDASDRVLQKTPYSFDVSVWEFFWPLAVGAGLVVARPDGHKDPGYLSQVIHDEAITTLHFVPSMLRAFLDADPSPCPGLRRVMASGEELPTDMARRFAERFPDAELHNLYGPTEAAVDVTAWPCQDLGPWPGTPIGLPIDNLRIHLLDSADAVPVGIAGELFIGGVGVGRGYYGRPGLTAERFVPDPYASTPGDRLYRTGDLARRRPDGAIEFLGRIDHQVKLRGFRIELGEIESALRQHDSVAATVVTVRGEGTAQRLVAYVAGRGEKAPTTATLRAHLRERLPEYMVPAAWVTLDEMPLLPNGKVNRKALPEPTATVAGERVAPRNPYEDLVADLWQGVLGLGDDGADGDSHPRGLGVTDNLFDLGAHSLLATQVKSRLDREFDIDIPLRRLFDLPTVEQQAAEVEALRQSGAVGAPRLEPLVEGDTAPLSFSQQRLWFFDRWESGSAVFNIPAEVILEGELSVDLLAASLDEVARRHGVLRTRFEDRDGEPVQIVEPFASRPLEVVDLSPLPVDERDETLERLKLEEASKPFDLERGSLWRAVLYRLGSEHHVAVLTLHHIIADGWSLQVLTRELSEIYSALASGEPSHLPPLPIQYVDYALWQRRWLDGEALEQQLEFWRQQIEGAPDALDLPFDRPRQPVQRFRGGRQEVRFSSELTDGLRRLAREEGGTLFMVLLTGWKALLSRYAHQADLSVGTLIANRHRREVEHVIGFFLNTLVLRSRLDRGASFRQTLGMIRETTLDVYAHQDLPFEKLVEELNPERHMSFTPLFQVLFILQNTPEAVLELPGLRLGTHEIERGTVNYDLLLSLTEDAQGLGGSLDYDVDLFDSTTVRRLLGHFEAMVRAMVEAPDRPWFEAPLLTSAERHQVLTEWNDTVQDEPSDALFYELFRIEAQRRGGRLAASCGEAQITYGELYATAGHGAAGLAEVTVAGEAAAILADRGLDFLATVLALQHAGCAYLPLDPDHPDRRVGQILAGSGVRLLLVSRAYGERVEAILENLPEGKRPVVRVIEALLDGVDPTVAAVEPRAVHPEDLGYVIFTSGSTGVPKGVMVDQRGLLNHLRANLEVLAMGEDDILAQNASQCFDISVWQFLAPLMVGGQVRIIPNAIAHDPAALLRETESSGLTVLELVPSLLGAMLHGIEGSEEPPALDALRWIIPTGEALPPALCDRWLGHYPDIPLVNAYGPAECADDVSLEAIRAVGEAGASNVPIGRPVRNLTLTVRGSGLRNVPLGVVGEICVGGVGVGRGYLADPRRTAAVFVPDPSGVPGARLYRSGDLGRQSTDGRLVFQGRIDHQVKVRGFRIEVGEVEAVLVQHTTVDEVVVMARQDGDQASARLVGYLTLRSGKPAAESTRQLTATLRGHMAERLPDYMVPSALVFLDTLPKNANGKIDLKALPAPEALRSEASLTAPQTATEKALAQVWQEVLGVESVGLEDNFFALGGHSLLATQVVARVRGALGVEMPLRDLFETSDLGALAERLGAPSDTDDVGPALVPAPASESGALSFAQERLWFLDQFDPDSAAYNLPNAVLITGELDAEVLERTLQTIVQRHDTLRMTFSGSGGRPQQTIHPEVALALAREDLSHLTGDAIEAEIQRRAVADAAEPFDLEEGPLLRTTLLRRSPQEHVLLISMHHIVSDGWSMGVMLGEVAAIYPALAAGQPCPLADLAIQYPDYGHWQRQWLSGERYGAQLDYWTEQLADAPTALDLPTRSSAVDEANLGRGGAMWFHLPSDLTAGVRDLGQARGATLFMTLLSGFAGVLARYSGADDLMIGVPIAGRGRTELEQLIGFFVNTLVIRVDLATRPSSEGLVDQVRQTSLEAFTHQDLPFEKLVAEINPDRDLDRSALFQVMFALQNTPVGEIELPDLTLRKLDIDSGTARFELYLELTEVEDHLSGMVQYSLDLFERGFIERFVGHYQALLEGMVTHPDRPLAALPLLTEAERRQLLGHWNDTAMDVPMDTPFQTLFEGIVQASPGRLAVACEDRQLTYAELAAQGGAVSHHLRQHGVGPDAIVAVMAERDIDFLTAVVGTFLAGAAYLPLDPKHPPGRIRRILDQSRASVVLTAVALEQLVREALAESEGDSTPQVFELEPLLQSSETSTSSTVAVPTDPDNLAYVIFTSGSTGVPKGAMLPQRGFVNHLYAMVEELGLTADDVVAQTASQCFDISVWQFLNPLVLGARVQIYPDAVAHDPSVLIDRVEADGVTVLEIVPSLMRLMLEELERRGDARPALGNLRWLIPTGEAVPPELCREWYAAYPHVPLLNVYGPAECSDDVSFYRIPTEGLEGLRTMPIGTPAINTSLYVLDRDLQPAPVGVAGELCIGGSGVGRGYLFDPAKTAAVFVPHPLAGSGERLYRSGDLARWRDDGVLEFLGRIDHQVKIRGLRLELGEIEAVLDEHPALAASVVTAQAEASGNQRLVAYLVAAAGEPVPEPAELRAFLERELPAYAVPSAWMALEALPLNANGKVDRKALPAIDDGGESTETYVAPRDEMEEAVAEIFASVIGREKVGVFDNFFDLGGHSLLATQALWQLRETFGVDLALRTLFEAPTIAELVGVIEDVMIEQIEDLDDDEVDALLDDEDLDDEDLSEEELEEALAHE